MAGIFQISRGDFPLITQKHDRTVASFIVNIMEQIIQFLIEADEQLLLAVNGAHTAMLDSLALLLSDKWIWIPFYIFLALMVERRLGWKRALVFLACVGVIIFITDQTCGELLRHSVRRMRPSNPDNPINTMLHLVNGKRGGSYGFPSCHAANTFALATIISLLFRRMGITLLMFGWCVAVSVSRVYMGVHYPSDLLGGFAVSGFYTFIIHRLTAKAITRQNKELCRYTFG